MTKRAALLFVCAVALLESVAQAYVPTRSKAGKAVHWPIRCIILSPDIRADASDDAIDPEDIDAALGRSVASWNGMIHDCSYMVLVAIPATRALEPVSDGRPSVVFRADFWGRGKKAYDPAAIGITTVWYVNRAGDAADGQISDADIELNAVNYTFTNDPAHAVARAGTKIADLENALTHELGHVLGLGHTCWNPKKTDPDDTTSQDPEEQPTDDQGNLVPRCDDSGAITDKIRNATMYPFADDGAVNMRIVSPDERAGICETYPIESTPTACYGYIEAGSCGFVAGAGHPAEPPSRAALVGALLAAALAITVFMRRRRARIRACRS